MYCEKCGTQNEEGVKFCSSCGSPMETSEETTVVEEAITTEEAAEEQPAMEETVQEEVVTDIDADEEIIEEEPKKDIKKLVSVIVAAVLVIVLVFAAYKLINGIFSSGEADREKMPLFYVTEDAKLNVLKADAKKPAMITDDDYLEDVTYYDGYEIVNVSEDGKKYCYIKEDDDGDKALYFRQISDNKGKREVLIDKDVDDFIMDKNGSFVLYRDGDKLYYSNMKKSYRLAKDISGYILTENGKNVIYNKMDEDSENYSYSFYIRGLKENDEEKKIVSGADSFMAYGIDEEGNEYVLDNGWYYGQDGDLFYKKNGKEPQKVLSDINNLDFIGSTLFATTSEKITIENDSDDSYSELEYLDEDYEKDGIQINVYKLYKLDGAKAGKPVAENLYEVSFSSQVVKAFKEKVDGKKFKSMEDLEDGLVYSILKADASLVSLGSVKIDDFEEYEVSEDEKYLYAIADIDEETNAGTLERYEIKSKEVSSKAEKILENVSYFQVCKDIIRVTTEDGDNSILGIYKNGKYQKISDKEYSMVGVFPEENVFYFLDDYDIDGQAGTLKKCDNGKVIEIAKNVYRSNIDFRSANMFYYLADYDVDEESGELFVCKGKKSTKIADNVKLILVY